MNKPLFIFGFVLIILLLMYLWSCRHIYLEAKEHNKASKKLGEVRMNDFRSMLANVPMFYEDGNFTAPVASKVTVIKVANKSRAKRIEVRHG